MTQILFSCTERLIAKISKLTITIYNSNTILIKTTPYTKMPILKHFKLIYPKIAKQSKEENVILENTITDFKTYCKAIVIKPVWYWYASKLCSGEEVFTTQSSHQI